MAITLYDATIPSFEQILGAVSGLLDKAEAFCREQARAPDDILQARLAADMLPFAYQVKASVEHSVGAIEGVRNGVFSPSRALPPSDFAALRQLVADAQATLRALDPQEVNSFEGRDMRFEFGDFRLDFTAETFLLSFSQPNFYFHATTAYDILRANGVQIGKRDFLGQLRMKR